MPGRAARSSTAASPDRAGLSGRDARGLGASEGEDEWASSQRRSHTARVLKLVFRVCRAHENVLLESFSPVATTAASPWEVPSLVLGWRPSPRAARRGRGARLRAHGTSRLLWAVSQSPLSQVGLPILPLPAVLDRMFVSPKCICWGTVPTVTVAGGGEAGRLGPWMGLVPFEEKQEPPGLSQPREDTEGGVRDGRGEPWDLSRPTSCQSREKWVSAVDEPQRPWCSVTAAELRHTVIRWLIRAACE